MQINTNVVKRVIFIVNLFIIFSVTIFSIGFNVVWKPHVYAIFYSFVVAMLLLFFVFRKLPETLIQYLGVAIMMGELVSLCIICNTTGFTQEAFILIISLFSLYLNTRLNVVIIFITLAFYVVGGLVANDIFFSSVSFIGESYIRSWMTLISEVFITVIVYTINKLKMRMTYKSQSSEDLLKLVEIKKKQAIENAHVKADFLANMSHEIRTPMNAVIGLTEIILRDPEINDNIRENVYNIKTAGNALITIINDILDFSKIESGKMEISPARYKISAIVNDTINVVSMRLVGKNVNLVTKINPEIPRELVGDDVRIRQILTNLLNNAVKFTKEGTITLEITWAHLSGDKAELKMVVSDTGIGIKESDLPSLFDSFKRLDAKHTRGIEGTGLGLSIVHNLVKLMGGDISVESVYGEGTSFTVTIPQRVSDPAPLAEVKNVYEKKVLFIDEVESSRETAQSDLQCMHVEYELAPDLDSVINKLGKYYSHLFVSKSIYDANAASIERFASANGKPKIILILDKNDVSTGYSGKIIIRRPVYCTLFSSVLNGEKVITYETQTFREAFTAPDAKLLVCDDNESNLRIMVGLLEPYKMKVKTVTSGYAAIDALKDEKFDIIFMDHLMPELDGIETARLIRQMPFEHCKTTPIIALTANAMSGAREMFLHEGFQGYVSKPIELSELENTIKSNLSPTQIVKSKNVPIKIEPATVLEIDGIDVGVGMHNCGGNRKNYLEILDQVVENGPKTSAMLTKYALEKDYKNYLIQAHALKSVCASIGALELSQYAKEHEFACREEKYDFVQNESGILVSRNDTLMENISAALIRIGEKTASARKQKSLINIEDAVIAITQVRTHIDDFEPDDALDILNELLDKDLGASAEKALDEIKKHVCDYEYDEAIEMLDALVTDIRKVDADE